MDLVIKLSVLLLALTFSTNVCGVDKKVIWVTPLWDSYTNEDGTGLYNDIVNTIYTEAGYSIKQITRSWQRSLEMVQKAEADITGGEDYSPRYNQSTFPILYSSENILYKKDKWGKWQGVENLNEKLGVWYEGYAVVKQEHLANILKGTDVRSRQLALEILLNGKRDIDYYFDNSEQMLQVMKSAGVSMSDYGLEMREVSQSNLHMVFQKTERGNRLKAIFDAGFERLYCNGDLFTIYSKWQHVMPLLDTECDEN